MLQPYLSRLSPDPDETRFCRYHGHARIDSACFRADPARSSTPSSWRLRHTLDLPPLSRQTDVPDRLGTNRRTQTFCTTGQEHLKCSAGSPPTPVADVQALSAGNDARHAYDMLSRVAGSGDEEPGGPDDGGSCGACLDEPAALAVSSRHVNRFSQLDQRGRCVRSTISR